MRCRQRHGARRFFRDRADARNGCPQETGGGRKAVQEPDIIHEFIKEAVSCIYTLTI